MALLPPRRAVETSSPAGTSTDARVDVLEALLGVRDEAFLRVDAVQGGFVFLELGTSRLAVRQAWLPKVKAGQWLKLERTDEGVEASVDLPATLDGEAKLMELFAALLRPRQVA